jgi:hypothetical protein
MPLFLPGQDYHLLPSQLFCTKVGKLGPDFRGELSYGFLVLFGQPLFNTKIGFKSSPILTLSID